MWYLHVSKQRAFLIVRDQNKKSCYLESRHLSGQMMKIHAFVLLSCSKSLDMSSRSDLQRILLILKHHCHCSLRRASANEYEMSIINNFSTFDLKIYFRMVHNQAWPGAQYQEPETPIISQSNCILQTRGPFLESPGNLTGPKSDSEIKISRKIKSILFL